MIAVVALAVAMTACAAEEGANVAATNPPVDSSMADDMDADMDADHLGE